MANYMTTDTELTAIADAIRAKASGGGRSGYKDYILGLENSVSVNDPDSIITVTYPVEATCTCSDGTTTLTAPNTSGNVVFGVEIGTWEITVNKDGKEGNEEVIIESRRQSEKIEITTLLPAIGTTLNNCTWNEISLIAQAGKGDIYFDIGDCKAVTLNGKIGDYLTLSNTTLYVFILDFNHPINKTTADNNIIWSGFKTALTGGIDVALCDSGYGGTYVSGKYFTINHVGSSSSPYNTNYGGWKGCDFRYDILGGTSTKPSPYNTTKTTSTTGYDATQATIDTPVANTLMAAFPSDLRAILRLWDRYVDNKGIQTISSYTNCSTATIDALSLLAEFEIFGKHDFANIYEQYHQKQMAYYAAGNLKKKYKHNATGTACRWWESSAQLNSNAEYLFCLSSNGTSNASTNYSYGLAPAFKT